MYITKKVHYGVKGHQNGSDANRQPFTATTVHMAVMAQAYKVVLAEGIAFAQALTHRENKKGIACNYTP